MGAWKLPESRILRQHSNSFFRPLCRKTTSHFAFFLNFVLGLIRLRHINVILKSYMNNVVTEDMLTSFPKIMFASITTFARKNYHFRLNIKERLHFCRFPNREWVWKKWRQIFVELKFSRPIKIGSTGKQIMNSQ